jgi:hypothetical protein
VTQHAELLGGPVDGQRRELPAGPLPPVLEYSEPDPQHPGGGPSPTERLIAGEVVPAVDFEHYAEAGGPLIIHVYRLEQPTRRINKAWVYVYEGVQR